MPGSIARIYHILKNDVSMFMLTIAASLPPQGSTLRQGVTAIEIAIGFPLPFTL